MDLQISPRPHSRGSIREYVYQTLKKNILQLRLEPGRIISEKEIAELLQVSRTPVRESFVQLSQEELIDIYPQKGTFISLINLEHVEEARFVREQLERAVVRLACDMLIEEDIFQLETNLKMQELSKAKKNDAKMLALDEEFHNTIFRGCGKSRTWNMIQLLNTHFYRMRSLRLAAIYDWKKIITQHEAILHAIKEKDPDQAEKVMMNHLRLVAIEKEELKELYPNYFS